MRASRQFRPTSMLELEGRVVPGAMVSHAPAAGLRPGEFRPAKLPAAEIAQSNASEAPFGLSPNATILAGLPVAEQLTTKYTDGSVQTESLLEVPDLAKNSVTTYETINLPKNRGIQTVVDTETFPSGTAPVSGNDNTHTVTTTLPDGSIQTQTYSLVVTGNKTVITGTTDQATGGVATWTSVKIKKGPTTTANKTITEPNGTVEHQTIITTYRGELDYTTTSRTSTPGARLFSLSATNVIRVQPPSSS